MPPIPTPPPAPPSVSEVTLCVAPASTVMSPVTSRCLGVVGAVASCATPIRAVVSPVDFAVAEPPAPPMMAIVIVSSWTSTVVLALAITSTLPPLTVASPITALTAPLAVDVTRMTVTPIAPPVPPLPEAFVLVVAVDVTSIGPVEVTEAPSATDAVTSPLSEASEVPPAPARSATEASTISESVVCVFPLVTERVLATFTLPELVIAAPLSIVASVVDVVVASARITVIASTPPDPPSPFACAREVASDDTVTAPPAETEAPLSSRALVYPATSASARAPPPAPPIAIVIEITNV